MSKKSLSEICWVPISVAENIVPSENDRVMRLGKKIEKSVKNILNEIQDIVS